MGMNISGRNPKSPAGKCFCANVWSWRSIHALIVELCPDLLDGETLDSMAFNNGAGPTDHRTCTEMANRFERWMERHVDGHDLEVSGARIAEDGHFVTEKELLDNPDLETYTPYGVKDEALKERIEFAALWRV